MPDKATLASIGFRTVPRWWQEKVAIQLGQSAIPTVGPVMKPEEWLKQRRGSQDSQDSQSDGDTDNEHESEIGGENELKVDTAPTTLLTRTETALDPAKESDEKAAAPGREKIDEFSDKNDIQAPAIATTEPANEPSRKLSDGDLIDLSPISPTVSQACQLNGTNLLDPIKTLKPCPTKTPPPSLPAGASKRPTASPRKVFVPAGESTEFHVADARKHAQTQKVELKEDSIGAKQCKTVNANTEKHSSTTSATMPKRPEAKSGLMASMHAPSSDRLKSPHCNNGSPSSANKSPRPPKAKSNLLPEPKQSEHGRAKKKATTSLSCNRPASRTAGPSDPTRSKTVTVDHKDASQKPTRSTGNESPRSVCRPRRPAASNSKAVSARAVTGGTKE
jgi:hypothetical protein